MVCTVFSYHQGCEVFNTYGQISNYTLLLMYGFCVPADTNPNNTVEIPSSVFKSACKLVDWPCNDDRWRLLAKKVPEKQTLNRIINV